MTPCLKSFADRLNRELPKGIRLVAVPPASIVYHNLKGEPEAWIDVETMLAQGDVALAGYNILNAVQDYVIRDTTTP